MKQMGKRTLCLLLMLVLTISTAVSASAAVSDDTLAAAVADTAQYLYETVTSPQVGSIGGEWTVLGLARSGYAVPAAYYQDYYAAVEAYVKSCDGNLHDKKYTEYSRVIVALSAIGKDARDVAGYDLTVALGDYDKTIWQGINGPIWALIALDSRNYPMPENPEAETQATRQMYVDEILSRQLAGGGWNLTAKGGSGSADPDITGMALQALAKYQDQAEVRAATEDALSCLSAMQDSGGGFASWDTANSESVVQVIVALCELGVSLDDPRFVKNGNTLLDNLMTYCLPGSGFRHTQSGGGSNLMATEQAFYGMVAVQRARQGQNSLYRMSDAIAVGEENGRPSSSGLPGKHADVTARPITAPGKTFDDISGANAHENQLAIEALAARGIIDGRGGSRFDPDAPMTRAEFSAIVVRALGLKPAANDAFTDVPSAAWYAPYVGTANTYGLINGVGGGRFNPEGNITRQEAAVLVSRAADLCGMDTDLNDGAVRDVLAQFTDYVATPEWAREGLAFCYQEGILDDSALNIQGSAAILRCEIAQMLYNLLGSANLL